MQLLRYELNGTVYGAFEIPADALSAHEERTLRLGVCRAVLPIAFVENEGRVTVLFDREETEPLTAFFRRERGKWETQGDMVLRFAMRIVRGLLEAENHFLPLSLFAIDAESVRVRPDDAALFLLPHPGREHVPDETAPRRASRKPHSARRVPLAVFWRYGHIASQTPS